MTGVAGAAPGAVPDLPAAVSDVVAAAHLHFAERFAGYTERAIVHFEHRAWRALQADAAARLELYTECVDAAVERVRDVLGADAVSDRSLWATIKRRYAGETADRPDAEIAATFHNSVTRRIFHTEGVAPEIEFVADRPVDGEVPCLRFGPTESLETLLGDLLRGLAVAAPWQNAIRDVRLAAAEVRRQLTLLGAVEPVTSAEIIAAPFVRGQGAYLVGRLTAGSVETPLVLAVHHTTRGLLLGAVLLDVDDLSVLFSYTRSPFFVSGLPGPIVAYLEELMPHKRRAELYTAIGHHKHGKTELYRDLASHVRQTEERFEHAVGIPGMVMIVFTLPDYDVVFKVIRDRFAAPKQTSRMQVMEKYRLVFRHDRAGRLIDAQEFEHLRFDRARFAPELLAELAGEAARTVEIDGDHVTLHHVYVERRVVPLDVFLRGANPVRAAAAMIDYGWAIKNLAASNIFPGDMLLKNFGVTRSGRVVFYDYDELRLLVECNFREFPDTDDPLDAMSSDPWFGVGENDVFPEELPKFLGIRGELRELFMYHHGDLFGVRFWRRMQERLGSGEVIEIFPYARDRRLGANIRRRTSTG